MTLSCDCSTDHDWYYDNPDNYSILQTTRRKRCCSCKNLIDIGAICLSFESYRPPKDDIEERIHGDMVYTANKYMCEECGDMFFSLIELGFCVTLGIESMRELTKEYAEVYG